MKKRVFLFKKSNLTSQLLEKFANSVDLTRGRHAYMIFILFYFLLLFKTLFDPISLCWSLFLPFSSQERQEDNYAKTTSPKNFYSFIHSFFYLFYLNNDFFFYHNPGSSYKNLSWSTMQFSIRKLKNNI